jgi:NADPH-dependent curcumin reductase
MRNRQVVVTSLPTGIPRPHHFELRRTEIPAPRDGEFLVSNHFLSVDPDQHEYASDESSYTQSTSIGDVKRAMAVGKVVNSRCKDVEAGDYLYGWFGLQDYCCATSASILRRVNPAQAPLASNAGLLGINGLTAYLALQDIGMPRPGEVVLVSAAAGPVGCLVGQLARLAGAHPIALVGCEEKGARCLKHYGYEAFVNYKKPLNEGLRQACPDRVDLFFDNIGGGIHDIVLRHMREAGRVVRCDSGPTPPWSPTPTSSRIKHEILTRGLRVEGFSIFDHVKRFDDAAAKLAELLAQGSIRYHEDVEGNIANAPQALADVYAGRSFGKKLIWLR